MADERERFLRTGKPTYVPLADAWRQADGSVGRTVHDFTVSSWAHHAYLLGNLDADGFYGVKCCGPVVRDGDELVLLSEDGEELHLVVKNVVDLSPEGSVFFHFRALAQPVAQEVA